MSQSDNEVEPVFWSVNGVDHGKLYNNPEEICVDFNNVDRDYNTEEQPLDWINWVRLYIDEENNSVGLNISNGDPRGSQIGFHLKKYIREGEQFTYGIDVIEKSLSNAELIGSYNIDLNRLKINNDTQAANEKLKQELLDAKNKIKDLEEKIKDLEKLKD